MNVTRETILAMMARHETLTVEDMAKEENFGFIPDSRQFRFIVDQLRISGHLTVLNGVSPATYTITDTGIQANTKTGQINT